MSWYIFHLKGVNHSPLWSRQTFLYDTRKTRYKQNNVGYHILKFWNNEQSNILKSDTPYCFAYISPFWYRTKMFLYSRESYGSHLSNEICTSLLPCLEQKKLSKNCGSFHTIEDINWCLWGKKCPENRCQVWGLSLLIWFNGIVPDTPLGK